MVFKFDNIETINAKLRESMFELRKYIFCDRLKWDIPHYNGLESDMFDYKNAYYLNWTTLFENRLIGSLRLMPMTQPTLLSTVFKNTVTTDNFVQIYGRSDIWEITRLCFDDTYEKSYSTLYQMIYAMFNVCFLIGIQEIVFNCDSLIYRRYQKMGLKLEHLGNTSEFRHGIVHCVRLEISDYNYAVIKSHLLKKDLPLDTEIIGEAIQSAQMVSPIQRKISYNLDCIQN